MKSVRPYPNHARQGFAVIALLIVVTIILVIMFCGPLAKNPVTQVTEAQTNIDRSADVSCSVNRNTIKTYVATFQINNPGMAPSVELLGKMYNLPPCPRGGIILIGKDGTVYCTKHDPPPAQELERLMANFTPTPTPVSALPLAPLPAGPPPSAAPRP